MDESRWLDTWTMDYLELWLWAARIGFALLIGLCISLWILA